MIDSGRMRWLTFTALAAALVVSRQPAHRDAPDGDCLFEQFCSKGHGADGRGGERGPDIVDRLVFRNDRDLASLIRDGLPSAGMPGLTLSAAASGHSSCPSADCRHKKVRRDLVSRSRRWMAARSTAWP
jgi:hypothetical protein